MPPTGSADEPRITVAPPAVGDAKSRRAGYLALLASSLITATTFAGIADIAGTTITTASLPPTHDYERAPSDSSDDADLIPGNASPKQGDVAVSGAVSTSKLDRSKLKMTTPTTVIVTNPDGTTTTTVIRPDGTTTTTTSDSTSTTVERSSPSSSPDTTSSTSETSETSSTSQTTTTTPKTSEPPPTSEPTTTATTTTTSETSGTSGTSGASGASGAEPTQS